MLARKTESYWGGEICVQWEGSARNTDRLAGKWVNELDLALALGKPSYGANRGINTRRSKSQRNLRAPARAAQRRASRLRLRE